MITAASLKAVWNFRSFVAGSVRREFQLRYRGTMLGVAWTILQPLTMILIYMLVFSRIMQAGLPAGPGSAGVSSASSYGIFLCAGIVAWGLFAEILQRSQSVFVDNANLLKKLSFPPLTLPVIVVATALLNFAIVSALFLAFLLLTGKLPGMVLLALIPLVLVQVLFAVGLGVACGVLNVFFRDVGQLTGLLLQVWFWATPIVYPASILPDWLRPWIALNPMLHLIQGYQDIFVARQWPDWGSIALVALVATVIAFFAIGLFRRHADEMVDEL